LRFILNGLSKKTQLVLFLACLHDQAKSGFFPANQGYLKTFQIALIDWIKAGLPKKSVLF